MQEKEKNKLLDEALGELASPKVEEVVVENKKIIEDKNTDQESENSKLNTMYKVTLFTFFLVALNLLYIIFLSVLFSFAFSLRK